MVQKNLMEALGLRATASQHWNPHAAVGLSALCFGPAACAFIAVLLAVRAEAPRPLATSTMLHCVTYFVLCTQYVAAILTCWLADYMYIRRGHRSFYGKVDIVHAGATFIVSVCDFVLRAPALEVAVVVGLVCAFFGYSGLSKSFEQWVFRHCLWHVGAGCIGVYGALRLPPDHAVTAALARGIFIKLVVAYAIIGGCILGAFYTLVPPDTRAALWKRGAHHANWTPVPLR
eukprot:TRINITY_DN5457_c0_g6_i1.p2 TRINITY_DN5457_c0_g6~~TRINITY_DN5457_c0_g6_i1.p2  ORF type:complete len:254 (-),score=44.56 TRINITY_DN5457_c0_g6_i1:69-761(-)